MFGGNMAENNDDWKEIDTFAQKEKADMIEKYGLDLYEKFQKKTSKGSFKKRKNIKKIAIMINIVLIIVLVFICWANSIQLKYKLARINNLKSVYLMDFEEKIVNSDITGNGFFIYKIEEIPELEIHAISKKGDDTFVEDVEARIYKYFFERWNNPNKSKFNVEESYEDYTHGLHTQIDWILKFKTYIEVNNYEEMIEATETIIDFLDYMSYPQIIVESYIKYNNQLILPHNVSIQNDDEIRESAKVQFWSIERGKRE